MPTVFTHAATGLAIATLIPVPGALGRLVSAGALAAVFPISTWSSTGSACRGATRRVTAGSRTRWHSPPCLLFLATASHGVLDSMTNGGPGVALLAPFDGTRYFLPWRPIPVSPISPSRVFTQRGLDIVQTEILLIWIPTAALTIGGAALRGRRQGRA